MFANLNGWHMLILLAVVLLLFGAPKLPALARSVGQSMRILRTEVSTLNDGDTADPAASSQTEKPRASAAEK